MVPKNVFVCLIGMKHWLFVDNLLTHLDPAPVIMRHTNSCPIPACASLTTRMIPVITSILYQAMNIHFAYRLWTDLAESSVPPKVSSSFVQF